MMQPEAQKASLPPLRQELRIEPGAALINGAPSWTLFDPVRHLFFQLGKTEFKIFSSWASGELGDLKESLSKDGMEEEEIDAAFNQVVEFSLTNALTLAPLSDTVGSFSEQRASQKKAAWKWMLDNYLFIRIPLVKPSGFLKRTIKFVEPLWSHTALTFFALLAVSGLFLVSRQWDAFLSSFLYFFSWEGLIAYGIGLFFVKILHELGHAYTATRFGCRIPAMGISFLVMMPVLYTDTSAAWRLTSRKKRLMIDCAGISVELMIAALSTMAWIFLPDGMLRSVAFILATTSWVMSLAINLNPFMRFDGYYLLSDLIGVPNLQPRAFALGKWRLRELLFALGDTAPEIVSDRLRRGMIVYAWATWLYRLVLFIGIALLVYTLFFKLLGVILFIVEIAVFIARPVFSELKIWWAMKDRIAQTPRSRKLFIGLMILLVLGLLPLDRHVSAPAVLSPIGAAPIVSGNPAKITNILIENGERVEAGTPLIELSAPDIAQALADTDIRISQLTAQLNRGAADEIDLSNRQVTQRELKREQDKKKGLQKRSGKLLLRAPISGIVSNISPEMHAGRWINGTENIAYVITAADYDVRAFVKEDDVARLRKGGQGRFIPDDAAQGSVAVKLEQVSPSASERLDEPILASVNGGDIATDERDEILKPREALYRVQLIAAKRAYKVQKLIQKIPGRVEVDAQPRSLLGTWLGRALRGLRQESSLTG